MRNPLVVQPTKLSNLSQASFKLTALPRLRRLQAPWLLETRRFLEAATLTIKTDFRVE
jgi:hypothetical protein